MWIATLPPIHRRELLEKIINHPMIGGVRYNSGYASGSNPEDTLITIIELIRAAGKKLWIDLKGRQLRIDRWATPDYGKIVLNHEVEIYGQAFVLFRGESDLSEIVKANGRVIYVDPPPKYAVGQSQAINVAGDIRIKGFLTNTDIAYVKAAVKLGNPYFMLSFVEQCSDWQQVKSLIMSSSGYSPEQEYELVLKIESTKGWDYASRSINLGTLAKERLRLMAARDDLMINIGSTKSKILKATQELINIDRSAIAASRLFANVEKDGKASLGDFADLHLLYGMGYRHFMISDGVCLHHFDEAIAAANDYYTEYPQHLTLE
jgi:pyruvate kinase